MSSMKVLAGNLKLAFDDLDSALNLALRFLAYVAIVALFIYLVHTFLWSSRTGTSTRISAARTGASLSDPDEFVPFSGRGYRVGYPAEPSVDRQSPAPEEKV